ncbi:hypothetical protein MBN61_03855 [Candidatus Saccharibacteria bacterium]|nr:hypothetical protein [Candidatus Saccharibacteria bacterium]
MSPDEQLVVDLLNGEVEGIGAPDGLLVIADSTALRRSLLLFAEVVQRHMPTALVLTMGDELNRRGGSIDTAALSRALGVPVVSVVANRGIGIGELRDLITGWRDWTVPPVDPPADTTELAGWVDSVLTDSGYRDPHSDASTEWINANCFIAEDLLEGIA